MPNLVKSLGNIEKDGGTDSMRRFSNSFEINSDNEIGPHDVASSSDFPDLGSLMTSATFQIVGKYLSLSAALKTISLLRNCFKNSPVIRSSSPYNVVNIIIIIL